MAWAAEYWMVLSRVLIYRMSILPYLCIVGFYYASFLENGQEIYQEKAFSRWMISGRGVASPWAA